MREGMTLQGPESGAAAGCLHLAEGVWLTSGRAAVIEGHNHLAVIDPGDEPCGSLDRPAGPLADTIRLIGETGKPLRWILLTHSHPDHVMNLPAFRAVAHAAVVAHAASPLGADVRLRERGLVGEGLGLEAIPTPGHSAAGDDLTFWLGSKEIVFTGDVVQPKGEAWDRPFYPSPYPYFTDGEVYLESLESIGSLPFSVLVTGHREVRGHAEARQWVELTARAIRRVGELVAAWPGPDDLRSAAPVLYAQLARERGIPEEAIRARLERRSGGPSAFELFDLPGIADYWARVRSGSSAGAGSN
ncbi:MAG: MBL fold metallo-hydrolase [Deltaproteobacteria bacterium]|nr:MBL fold metallo-hydrolase [Deltaproteobacteria bacterium]